MAQRRKTGAYLNIPFIDDTSGVMANGVVMGRPATPPIIRITIPESEVYEPKVTQKKVTESKAQNKNSDDSEKDKEKNSNGDKGDDVTDSDKPEKTDEDALKSACNPPLTKKHRRNSISLPAGLNNLEIQQQDVLSNYTIVEIKIEKKKQMESKTDSEDNENIEEDRFSQVIPENHNGDTDDTFSEADESEYNTDAEEVKVPLRSARKKSVMPMRAPVTDSDLEVLDHSPGNSITSINSISSLLKEKLSMVPLPSLLKVKRKPKNYKLKAFVCILFMCIVFLVAFAYVFYHQQVLQRAYFERIRFNNEEKIVRVYDNDGEELLSGYLGTTINSNLVFKCLKENEFDDGSVCMEWMHRARLYLRFRNPHPGVRCYQITWQSLNDFVNPTDCFDWSRGGHWYGGGQVQNMTWPAELGVIRLSPFITGDTGHQQWGNVLQRYFLNSRGVSISIDQETPLYIALDTFSDEKRFCLQARYDNFVYYYHNTVLPVLNYSICTSNNIKILHGYMSEKSLWDGLKEEDVETVYSLLTEPVWQIGPDMADHLTESAIYNYTEDVIALAFLRQGHVLLNEMWQENIGDFTVDEKRFPTMTETIKILQRRGFKIVLTIQPFISTESHNFKEAMQQKLLVSERSRAGIPALTRYKQLESAGMLDITNNKSIPWIQQKLLALVKKYNINSFYLDLGSTYNMPHFYRFERNLVNPDEYKTLFTEGVLQLVEVIGVSSAVKRPKPPVFVSLPPLASSWESLSLIIPTVLTYGIIGYPFIMPGPVGGDYYSEATLANYTHMYIKSVENVLLHKSIATDMNKLKAVNESQNPQTLKNNNSEVVEGTTLEEDFISEEENSSNIPKEDEVKKILPAKEPENVFSTNYDNFFNKKVNPAAMAAAEVLKSINATKTNILEKASESFPGDVMLSDQAPNFVFLPDKELYIRWLQLATFLPVIRFTHIPSKYKDESVLEIAKILTHLRVKIVNPLLKKYAKEALDSGLPIIRPLWMLDPSDPACHTIVDEFSVGDELIVAPVIQVGTTEREVYLPAGVWKDGIDGSLRKGSRWIHKYKVAQDKIAYFVKMPDNTRF